LGDAASRPGLRVGRNYGLQNVLLKEEFFPNKKPAVLTAGFLAVVGY
jgi:hypothetical protein